MKRAFSVNMQRRFVRILITVVLLVLLSQVLASNPPVPLRPRKVPVPEAHKERIAKGLAGNFGLGPFQPSLEMKENVDFLLTPALLVQEAICDDVVITYPTE